jgi:hypothetical protein
VDERRRPDLPGRREWPTTPRRRAAHGFAGAANERQARATDTMVLAYTSPGLQTAGFDQRSTQRDPRAGVADRRPGHRLRSHASAGSATSAGRSSQRRVGGLCLRWRPDGTWALVDWSTATSRRNQATEFDALSVANAISARGLPGDVYRAATVRTGKLVR